MSAYRSGSRTEVLPSYLLCSGCGQRVEVDDEPECTCRSCGLAQATLRVDADAKIANLRLVGQDTRSYGELDAFARTVKASEGNVSITVDGDGVQMTVSLSLNSGSANGLELQAATRGFPAIRFTSEGDSERQAKETGLSREVQTGDEVFDRAVYIDTEVVDAQVKLVLSSPAVREAIVDLLREFSQVVMDDASISVSTNHTEPSCYRPENVHRWLALLRIVAGAPRPRAVQVAQKSMAVRFLQAFSFVFLPLGGISLGVSGHFYKPLHAGNLVVFGAMGGLAVWAVSLAFIRRALAGRSSSHTDVALTTGSTFLGFPMLAVATLFVLNGAFDHGAERVQTGKVTSTSFDSEDDDTKLDARGPDLDVDFRVHDPQQRVKVGDEVTVWTKPGRLGHPWPNRPAEVKTATGTMTEK